MTFTHTKPLHGQGRECVITRRACFSSSHRYWLPEKSSEDNFSLFGKCSIAPGHGHNYELIVSKNKPIHDFSITFFLPALISFFILIYIFFVFTFTKQVLVVCITFFTFAYTINIT